MMALILPVIPATGLKRSVLAAAGIGTGAGGAGGLTVAGGSLLTGTVAKIAAVTVLAGGAGVATKEVVDRERAAPAAGEPAQRPGPRADRRPVSRRRPRRPPRRRTGAPPPPRQARRGRRGPAQAPAADAGRQRRRSRGQEQEQPRRRALRAWPPAGEEPGPDGAAGKPVVPPGQIRKQQKPAAAPKPAPAGHTEGRAQGQAGEAGQARKPVAP